MRTLKLQKAQADTYIMSPSAKGTLQVSELSNNQFNHNNHLMHVIAPEAPASAGGSPSPEPEEKKKKMSLKNKLLIGGAGVALAAVAATGIGIGAAASNGEKPAEATSSSAPANPSDTPSPSASESTPATPETTFDTEAGFSVEKYSTAEALSQAQAAMQTAWYNEGANKQTLKEAFSLSNNLSSEDFAAKTAAETDKNYIDSVLVNNWQSKGELSRIVDNYTTNHKNTLNLYIVTSNYDGSVPQDVEPYHRQVNLIQVISDTKNADGTWTIVTLENESDNSDKNRASELTGGQVLGEEGNTPNKVSTTWVQQDGKWLISDIMPLGE